MDILKSALEVMQGRYQNAPKKNARHGEHCLGVALMVQQEGAPQWVVAAAMLHDCLYGLDAQNQKVDVSGDLPMATVELISQLYQRMNETPLDVLHRVKYDHWGLLIKVADLTDALEYDLSQSNEHVADRDTLNSLRIELESSPYGGGIKGTELWLRFKRALSRLGH